VLLDNSGAMFTPNMYAFERALLMFEIAFGTATQQQENEFKAMKQGSMTADAFAYKLEYLNRTLLTRNYTDSYLVRLFVNGLQDRECAASLQSKLQYMPATQVKLITFRQLVKTYYESKQEGLQVQTDSEVAARMLGKLNIKTPSSGAQPESQLTDHQRMQQLMKHAKELGFPANHDMSPCILPRHNHHCNMHCRDPKHPRNMKQQQPTPAAGMHGSSSNSSSWQYPAPPAMPYAPHMPAAALQGGKAAPASPANPNGSHWWQGGQQQQQQQQQRQQPANQRCSMCNASHSDSSCWYNDPRQAPAHWAPSEAAPYKAIQLYQRRCAELGIAPKAPGARAAPSSPQQRGRAPPRAQAAAAAFADPNGQPDLHAAALMPEAAEDTESLGGWFMAGSYMHAQDDNSNSSNDAGATFAAAIGGRDKQPLSFLPPASVQPRIRATAAGTAADTPAAAAIAAGDVQMQITFAGPPAKLQGLLQQMTDAGLLETTAADAASSGARMAAAAAPGKPPGLDPSSLLPAVEPSRGNVSLDCNASSSSSSACNGAAADALATAMPAAALLGQAVVGQLANYARPGCSSEQLVADFKASSKIPTMLTFTGTEPANMPMIVTDKGPVMPFKPVADSGCEPNIMTRAQADACQLYYRPLKEGELNIMTIEGNDTSCFIGRTDPVSVVFGYGTDNEVSLYCKDGFLINGNPAAEKMYSCVLGRSCVDKVSGFVVPVLQTFFYMPRLEQHDLSAGAMPVRLGRSQPSSSSTAASLTALADPPLLFACGATLQDAPTCSSTGQGIKEEESTTDQGSSTASSARPALHFCSRAPADDVLCSMPAPQKATFEHVDNSSGSAHAAAPAEVSTGTAADACSSGDPPTADVHSNSSTNVAEQQAGQPYSCKQQQQQQCMPPTLCDMQLGCQLCAVAAVLLAVPVAELHWQHHARLRVQAHALAAPHAADAGTLP
jgi:hypothetical protein